MNKDRGPVAPSHEPTLESEANGSDHHETLPDVGDSTRGATPQIGGSGTRSNDVAGQAAQVSYRDLPASDRQFLLEEEEHASAILRLRKGTAIGFWTWSLFGIADWVVVSFIEPGSLIRYYSLRALGCLVIFAGWVRLRSKPPPSRRLLWAIDFTAYTTVSVLVSLMCVEFRGITSPYYGGVLTVLVARSVIMPQGWKHAPLLLAGPTLAYPVTLLIAATLSPSLAAQFRDPRAVATFILSVIFVFASYGFMVFGGRARWALRRKVFEERILGRYRLKRSVGAGGMGEVWIAYDGALKRDVAIKILHPTAMASSQSGNAVARFEREVHATAALTHPNTIRIFDYGVTEDGLWYYAMELLEGEDLAAVVRHEGPLTPRRATHIMTQAARALAEAHAHGIVHRDVKPENLFLASLDGEKDFVKVLDFGIARLADTEPDSTLTSTGTILGTPAYMSPEGAEGKPTSVASDIYSLGAVLYFLVTASPPFEGQNRGALLFAHLHEDPVPPSARVGRPLPRELEQVIMQCLQKDPAARFASANDLAAALSACREAPALP